MVSVQDILSSGSLCRPLAFTCLVNIKQVESDHVVPFHVPQKETGDIWNLPDIVLLVIGGHEIVLEGHPLRRATAALGP